MSPAEAVLGWLLVTVALCAGGLAAIALSVLYGVLVAGCRRRKALAITQEDRAAAAVADYHLLAEVAREFAEHSR